MDLPAVGVNENSGLRFGECGVYAKSGVVPPVSNPRPRTTECFISEWYGITDPLTSYVAEGSLVEYPSIAHLV